MTFGDNAKCKTLGTTIVCANSFIENEYYIEFLKFNLLNMSQLSGKGNNVISKSSKCLTKHICDNACIYISKRHNNIFIFVVERNDLSITNFECLSIICEDS